LTAIPTCASDSSGRRAAGQLSHPSIITIHDLGEDNGVPTAMEYLEGEDLQRRMAASIA
jgi:serine/threonine protein kinase